MLTVSPLDSDQLATLRVRFSQLTTVDKKVKQVEALIATLPTNDRNYQLRALESAKKFLKSALDEAPPTISTALRKLMNELTSLKEGVYVGSVEASDLVLLSAPECTKKLKQLLGAVQKRIHEATAPLEETDSAVVIQNLKKRKAQMPSFGDRQFLITKAPIVFSFATKSGHSSVGYINAQVLADKGFTSENLAGYTVLHDQMVIGVKYAKDSDKTPLEQAQRILKKMEAHAHVEFSLVTDTPTAYGGGSWFWVMSVMRTKKLAQAFPGNHLKFNKWSFSF